MVKFTEAIVGFAEIPDEISLCINISNCQNNCIGCHSPYLKENIGEELTCKKLVELINNNKGITCVCFMGVGNDWTALYDLIMYINIKIPSLKIAIYDGNDYFDNDFIELVDYYKVGHYDKDLGPINNPTSNQRLFKVLHEEDYATIEDITYKFYKHETEN